MIILTMKTTEEYSVDGQVVETNTSIPDKWVVRENWQGEDLEVFDTKTEAETFAKEYQQRQQEKATKKTLPTEITSSEDDFPLPDEFWNDINEFLQDKYGQDAGKYAESYSVEVIVSNIKWEDIEKGE